MNNPHLARGMSNKRKLTQSNGQCPDRLQLWSNILFPCLNEIEFLSTNVSQYTGDHSDIVCSGHFTFPGDYSD